jgi:hypothetical protein
MDTCFATDSDLRTKAETAECIALEASKLARVANSQKLTLLAHLIDMVVLEAWREATEPEGHSLEPG